MESLLNYSERFYERQFITRKISNHNILNRLEDLLDSHFNGTELLDKGIPSVEYISDILNTSPNYLSGVLKTITGKSTQEHIQDRIILKAKEKLSTTDLTINEIAFELGFDYPQSFSRLFKHKTSLTPKEFRMSFN